MKVFFVCNSAFSVISPFLYFSFSSMLYDSLALTDINPRDCFLNNLPKHFASKDTITYNLIPFQLKAPNFCLHKGGTQEGQKTNGYFSLGNFLNQKNLTQRQPLPKSQEDLAAMACAPCLCDILSQPLPSIIDTDPQHPQSPSIFCAHLVLLLACCCLRSGITFLIISNIISKIS